MKWKKRGKGLLSVPVLMLFFVLSENSQQKVWEEQEKHPDNPKQHLRRRGTTQLGERGWVNNQCHSRLLWEIHDLIKKICLPLECDHFSAFTGATMRKKRKKWQNSLRADKYFGKGKSFQKAVFSLRGNVWQFKMMLSEVESSHRGNDVLFAYEALCLVSIDHSIFAKLKPGCPK